MMPRYWTDDEGTKVGEWVEIDAKEWSDLIRDLYTVVAVQSAPGYMWTAWGRPGELPVGGVYSEERHDGFRDTRLKLVPLVEDADSVVAGPRRGPDPLPDVPAPDFNDGMPY